MKESTNSKEYWEKELKKAEEHWEKKKSGNYSFSYLTSAIHRVSYCKRMIALYELKEKNNED